MSEILIIHAVLREGAYDEHRFIELFTSKESKNVWIKNHPEAHVLEVTAHEVDPI